MFTLSVRFQNMVKNAMKEKFNFHFKSYSPAGPEACMTFGMEQYSFTIGSVTFVGSKTA